MIKKKHHLPRWYVITKGLYNILENSTIAGLLLFGFTAESQTMLIVKLCSSTIKLMFDYVLSVPE